MTTQNTSKISKYSEIEVSNPPGCEHNYKFYLIKLQDKKTHDYLHEYLIKKRIFSIL